MKRFDRLDLLPEGQDMVAGIDMVCFSALSERQLPCENPSDAL